jgi:hypothetical protein
MRFTLRSAVRAMTRTGALMLAVSAASAQEGVRTTEVLPQISLRNVQNGIMSLSAWPGISVTVDRDAFVAVFAITRGRADFPVQVLSPFRPGDSGRLKAGRISRVRSLDRYELLHLVNYGEAPVVVAFASPTKPDLSSFADRQAWGRDLLLDTAASSQKEMVDILGKTIFGNDVPYDVVVSSTSNPAPMSRYADVWAFNDECSGFTGRWSRRDGRNGFGLYDATGMLAINDPYLWSFITWSPWALSPFGWRYGVPRFDQSLVSVLNDPRAYAPGAIISWGRMFVGSTACNGYRVAWWPRNFGTPLDTTKGRDTTKADPAATGVGAAGDATSAEYLLGTTVLKSADDAPNRNGVVGDDDAWRRGASGSARRFPWVASDEVRALSLRQGRSSLDQMSDYWNERDRNLARRQQIETQNEINRNRRAMNTDSRPAAMAQSGSGSAERNRGLGATQSGGESSAGSAGGRVERTPPPPAPVPPPAF